MATKKETTVVAKKETTAVAGFTEEAALPSYMNPESTKGSENVGADDMIIPRLGLCQSLSPQRKKSDDRYIEGIEEGDMFNTVTSELYGNGVIVVPVFYRKEYLIWVSRDGGSDGNGFRGAFPTELEAAQAKNLLDDGDKCEIVETASNFCLLVKEDGSTDEIIVPMAKSQMKVSRKWNSLIRMAGGDRFSHGYKLIGVEESGGKGDYFNYNVVKLGYTPETVYKEAEALYEAIASGQKVADNGQTQTKDTPTAAEDFDANV